MAVLRPEGPDSQSKSYYESDGERKRWLEEIIQGRRKPAKKEPKVDGVEAAASAAVKDRPLFTDPMVAYGRGYTENLFDRYLDLDRRHPDMVSNDRIDVQVVKDWVSRVRYKPDTRFTVQSNYYGFTRGMGDVSIRVERRLADSTKPLQSIEEFAEHRMWIPVGCHLDVPTRALARVPAEARFVVFFEWLHRKVIWLERHEIDEWFRVDGQLPFDPHAFQGQEDESRRGREDDMQVPGRDAENGRLRHALNYTPQPMPQPNLEGSMRPTSGSYGYQRYFLEDKPRFV